MLHLSVPSRRHLPLRNNSQQSHNGHVSNTVYRIQPIGPCCRHSVRSSFKIGTAMASITPTERSLTFTNSHNEALSAKLFDTGSADIVILCHGYAGSKESLVYPSLATQLATRGRSSLRFDFSGNGESQGVFTFGAYWREVEDLRSAVQFGRRQLHKRVVAVVGHSKGGNIVLLYGSKYGDVPVIVNIAGRAHMARGIKERFGSDILERLATEGPVQQRVRADGGRTITYMLTKEAVDERLNMDMLAAAATIPANVQVHTIHGTMDTVIPVEDAHVLAGIIRQHSLTLVPGADHNFRTPGAAEELLRLLVGVLSEPIDEEVDVGLNESG